MSVTENGSHSGMTMSPSSTRSLPSASRLRQLLTRPPAFRADAADVAGQVVPAQTAEAGHVSATPTPPQHAGHDPCAHYDAPNGNGREAVRALNLKGSAPRQPGKFVIPPLKLEI